MALSSQISYKYGEPALPVGEGDIEESNTLTACGYIVCIISTRRDYTYNSFGAGFFPRSLQSYRRAFYSRRFTSIFEFRPRSGPYIEATYRARCFQNVLGLILAGLTSEALISLTGVWIAIGYRLILDHCPVHTTQRANKWRQLFSGLQVTHFSLASA